MRGVVFHEEADAEFIAGIARYLEEADDVRVALRFEAAVRRAVSAIAEAPARWPITDDAVGVRRYLLERPFDEWMLVYRAEGDDLRVLAVAHGRREPAYWRGRR